MTKRKIIITIACALAAVLIATSVVVTIVLVNGNKQETKLKFETNKISLEVGQTIQLAPTFPQNYSNVQWLSRNEAVATVDDNGNVSALTIGSAIIKLTITVQEQTQSALCQVNVVEKGAEAVGRMIVSDSKVTLFAGGTYTVISYLQFGNNRVTDIEWISNNTNVCTVSNGVITGVAQGNATVNASATYDGTKYTAQIDVAVAPKQQVLSFDLKNDYVVKDETTELSVYLVKDGKATKVDNSKVTYTVDSDNATLNGNKLTGVALGKVNLTATTTTETGEVSGTMQLDVLRYCTVSYLSEGSVVATEQVLNSKGATTSVDKPILDGYIFNEWKLNGESFAEGSIVNDDINVQASWYKLTNDSGEYVQKTIVNKYLDVSDFAHDGNNIILKNGNIEIQMQNDNVYNYFVTFPAFNFAGQGTTQFNIGVNYSGYKLSFNNINLVATSTTSDSNPQYDFVVLATADGGANLTNGSVTIPLTKAQANGAEGLTINFVRPNPSRYAQCLISPMFLCTFDYNKMLTDKADLLAEMTAESDKNEYFAYYTSYFDSLSVATPYERQHMTVPSGVTHAKSLLADGSYTLIDFTNDKHGVTAQKADGTTAYSIDCGTNSLTVDNHSTGLYTVCLPKVNYLLYKSVTFTYSINANWDGIGLESGNLIYDSTDDSSYLNGTVTITVTDGVATAVLHDNLLNRDLSIELSQDVANGTKQMQLLFDAKIYHKLTISNLSVTM